MTTETFKPKFAGGKEKLPEGMGDFTYYRKPPTPDDPEGEVTCAQPWESEHNKRIEQGWVWLRQYYCFPAVEQSSDAPGGWFRPLLERGGAKELSRQQIIDMGWAHHPPVIDGKPVVFPQMEGVEVEPLSYCEFCAGRWFTSQKKYRKHMAVMHADLAKGSSMAREIAAGISSAMSAPAAPVPQPPAPQPPAPQPQAFQHPFVCGICMHDFRSASGLAMHVGRHHKEESVGTGV